MDTSILVMSSLTFYSLIYIGLVYTLLKFCGLSREPSKVKDTRGNSRQYYYRSLQPYRADVIADGMSGYQKAA